MIFPCFPFNWDADPNDFEGFFFRALKTTETRVVLLIHSHPFSRQGWKRQVDRNRHGPSLFSLGPLDVWPSIAGGFGRFLGMLWYIV